MLSASSGHSFQDTDVWFSMNDSKSQGAGVSAFLYPSPTSGESVNIIKLTKSTCLRLVSDRSPRSSSVSVECVVYIVVIWLVRSREHSGGKVNKSCIKNRIKISEAL